MTMYKPISICAYVVKRHNNEWRYLLLRRCSKHLNGNWQMVSGGSEEHEIATQTALREIKEETGLIPTRLYSADRVEIYYEARLDRIILTPVFVAFIDNQQDVSLSPSEHDQYKWVTCQEALTYLEFANQREDITHIERYFLKQRPNERLRIL